MARLSVEILGQPIDCWAAGGVGPGVDRLDQLSPKTQTARGGVDVEVLQIADILDLPRVPVKQEMRETKKAPVDLGHQGAEILRVVAQ